MSISRTVITALFVGAGIFAGIVFAVSADESRVVAGCEEYTDSSNCDYDGEY